MQTRKTSASSPTRRHNNPTSENTLTYFQADQREGVGEGVCDGARSAT